MVYTWNHPELELLSGQSFRSILNIYLVDEFALNVYTTNIVLRMIDHKYIVRGERTTDLVDTKFT